MRHALMCFMKFFSSLTSNYSVASRSWIEVVEPNPNAGVIKLWKDI